jgi:hypothetical protein
MPPKKCRRTQLRITDIPVSGDTLQAAESTAELPTAIGVAEADIDDHRDDNLDNDFGGESKEASPIDNHNGDCCSQFTIEGRLDMAN